jgi:hypothetical protein
MSYPARGAEAWRRGPIARWGSDRVGDHTDRRPHATISGRIPVRCTGPLLLRAGRPGRRMGIDGQVNAARLRRSGARVTALAIEEVA